MTRFVNTPGTRPAGLTALLLPLFLLAAGCSNRLVTFNDQVVYSPNPALINPVFADASLQGCLNQILSANPGMAVAEIRTLACPEAGIESIRGISALRGLEQVELSGNRIDNLSELQPLRNLRVVGLRNNRIRNIGPLSALPLLRFVSLEGNDDIPCRQLDELGARIGSTLSRPEACAN